MGASNLEARGTTWTTSLRGIRIRPALTGGHSWQEWRLPLGRDDLQIWLLHIHYAHPQVPSICVKPCALPNHIRPDKWTGGLIECGLRGAALGLVHNNFSAWTNIKSRKAFARENNVYHYHRILASQIIRFYYFLIRTYLVKDLQDIVAYSTSHIYRIMR